MKSYYEIQLDVLNGIELLQDKKEYIKKIDFSKLIEKDSDAQTIKSIRIFNDFLNEGIFVEGVVHNKKLEKQWYEMTKDFIKLNGYKKMMDKFMKASEEVADKYWTKKSMPKHFFKGDLKITEIADDFGLKPLRRKLRVCPFHADKNPSLSLSNEKGVFNCFGCSAKGNIITFYAMLKKVRPNVNR